MYVNSYRRRYQCSFTTEHHSF